MPGRQRLERLPIEQLLDNGGFLLSLIGQLCDSFYILDIRGRLHYASQPFRKAPSAISSLTLKKMLRFIDASDRLTVQQAFRAAIRSRQSVSLEFRGNPEENQHRWYDANIIPVPDEHGEIALVVATAKDITERKRNELDLSHRAFHDALTGLPNRVLFQEHLAQALAHVRRSRQMLAVLYLDIDDFKLINDSMGHHAGDTYLRIMAERIRGCLRQSDSFARMGGDEFTILLSTVDSLESVVLVVKRIFQALQVPWKFENQEFVSTISMGISLYPINSDDAATLLKQSDIALYQVKQKGRNGFKFYAGL
ncbi:MAG: diguanylate cyclase [Paenibacillaceae bacterium]|nr:diguanylate cyclase [Paenibacillaceae bacterium]